MLAPFRDGDLPGKPHGFTKLIGPGAVLVGLAVGAGELVVWPIMTARFGAGIAWAAMLGILLQLIINIEVGRYTLATGESVYKGFARIGRAWVPVFVALNVFGWILPGWARTCAGAVKALAVGPDGPGEPWQWTALTFAVVGAVMFGPRNVYRAIERITISLVVLMLAGLIVLAVEIGDAAALADLARGVMNFGFKPDGLPTYELFSAIVFAGAGGTTNLMFSYYLINKGWGMAARGGTDSDDGPVLMAETLENRARWADWFHHVRNDQMLFFWLMNSLTILLFIFSAQIVLHAEGIVPSREMLVYEEAEVLARLWGRPGALLFMLVGIACLFSTQLTLLDGVARSLADLAYSNYEPARRYDRAVWYRGVAIGWMLAGTLLTWAWGSLPPFMFLLSAGFFGGIAMATYCPLLLVLNRTRLPRACRPGPGASLLLASVSAFYVVFAVTSVWVIGRRLIEG